MPEVARDISHWPDLQFWYGLSFTELRAMPNGIRAIYEEALSRLKAEQTAMLLDAVAYPHMKKQAQEKMSRKLNKDLRGGRKEQAEYITDGPEYTDRVLSSGVAIVEVKAGEAVQ